MSLPARYVCKILVLLYLCACTAASTKSGKNETVTTTTTTTKPEVILPEAESSLVETSVNLEGQETRSRAATHGYSGGGKGYLKQESVYNSHPHEEQGYEYGKRIPVHYKSNGYQVQQEQIDHYPQTEYIKSQEPYVQQQAIDGYSHASAKGSSYQETQGDSYGHDDYGKDISAYINQHSGKAPYVPYSYEVPKTQQYLTDDHLDSKDYSGKSSYGSEKSKGYEGKGHDEASYSQGGSKGYSSPITHTSQHDSYGSGGDSYGSVGKVSHFPVFPKESGYISNGGKEPEYLHESPKQLGYQQEAGYHSISGKSTELSGLPHTDSKKEKVAVFIKQIGHSQSGSHYGSKTGERHGYLLLPVVPGKPDDKIKIETTGAYDGNGYKGIAQEGYSSSYAQKPVHESKGKSSYTSFFKTGASALGDDHKSSISTYGGDYKSSGPVHGEDYKSSGPAYGDDHKSSGIAYGSDYKFSGLSYGDHKSSSPSYGGDYKSSGPAYGGDQKSSGISYGSDYKSSGPVHGEDYKSSGPVYGGDYKSSGPTHGGDYKSSGPSHGGDYKSSGPTHGGDYKSSGISYGGDYKSSGPAHGGDYKSSGISYGGDYKSSGPTHGGDYKSSSPAYGGDYKSSGPAHGGDYKSSGPAYGGDYKSNGPAHGGDYKSSGPVYGADHKSSGIAYGGDYKSSGPAFGGDYKSDTSAYGGNVKYGLSAYEVGSKGSHDEEGYNGQKGLSGYSGHKSSSIGEIGFGAVEGAKGHSSYESQYEGNKGSPFAHIPLSHSQKSSGAYETGKSSVNLDGGYGISVDNLKYIPAQEYENHQAYGNDGISYGLSPSPKGSPYVKEVSSHDQQSAYGPSYSSDKGSYEGGQIYKTSSNSYGKEKNIAPIKGKYSLSGGYESQKAYGAEEISPYVISSSGKESRSQGKGFPTPSYGSFTPMIGPYGSVVDFSHATSQYKKVAVSSKGHEDSYKSAGVEHGGYENSKQGRSSYRKPKSFAVILQKQPGGGHIEDYESSYPTSGKGYSKPLSDGYSGHGFQPITPKHNGEAGGGTSLFYNVQSYSGSPSYSLIKHAKSASRKY